MKIIQSTAAYGLVVILESCLCRSQHYDTGQSASKWVDRILGDKSARLCKLLNHMASWHLEGRQILNGNPIAIPILGANRYFRAETLVSHFRAETLVSLS